MAQIGIHQAKKGGGMLDMFGFGASNNKQKGNLVSLSSHEISGANPMRDSPTNHIRNSNQEANRRLTPTNTPGLNSNQKVERHDDFSITDSFDKNQNRSANPSPFQKVPKGTLQLNHPVTPISSSSILLLPHHGTSSNADKVKEKLISNMKNDNKKNNDLEILIERLQKKDATLIAIIMNNSNIISQKEENFQLLADCLKNNAYITSIELANVNMKDKHCMFLSKSWETMPNLVKLNVETNSLTGTGIEAIACIAEKHPSLKEIRVSNQRMAVGVEAERALANCLSQNTNITKLSHNFREKFVQVYADKYIQRNMDLQRQLRMTPAAKANDTTTVVPYPFPKRDIFEFAHEVMYPPSPSPTNGKLTSSNDTATAASSLASSIDVSSISGMSNIKKSFFPDTPSSSPVKSNATTTNTAPAAVVTPTPAVTSKPTPSSHITAMKANINTTTKTISPRAMAAAADSANNRVIISPRPTTTAIISQKYKNSSNSSNSSDDVITNENFVSPRSVSTPRGHMMTSSSSSSKQQQLASSNTTASNNSNKRIPLRSITPSPQQERVHQERTSFFARMTAGSKGKLEAVADSAGAEEQNSNNNDSNYNLRKLGNRQTSVGAKDMNNNNNNNTNNRDSKSSMFGLFSKGNKSPASTTTTSDTTAAAVSSSSSVYEPVTPKYSQPQTAAAAAATPAVIQTSKPLKDVTTSSSSTSSSSPSKVSMLASSLLIPQCKEASQSFNGVKNAFELIIERLQMNDKALTEIIMNNTNLISNKDENFKLLADCMRGNHNITNIELNNVEMKDSHCIYFADVWKTMLNLVKLNVETNSLTGMGIEAIADIAEKHPSLKEMRVSNQRMAVGVEAERALANCLSQNTNIVKLSHAFRERFVQTYVDKYIQRNLDLQRQQRVGGTGAGSKQNVLSATSTTATAINEPYPFPSRQQAEAAAALAASSTPLTDSSTPLTDSSSNNSTNNSSASNVLNNELKKLKSIANSNHTHTTAASSTDVDNDDDNLSTATAPSNISPVKMMMANMEKNNAKTTASINQMNAVLKKTPIAQSTPIAVKPLPTAPLSLSLPLSTTKDKSSTMALLSPKTSPRGGAAAVTTPRTKSLAELNINVSERKSLYEKNSSSSSSLLPRSLLLLSPMNSVEGDISVFSPIKQHHHHQQQQSADAVLPEVVVPSSTAAITTDTNHINKDKNNSSDDAEEDQVSQVSLTPPKNISIYDSSNSNSSDSSSITNSVNDSTGGVGSTGTGDVILMMSRESSPLKNSSPIDRAHETRKSIHTSKMGANFFIKQPTTGIKRTSIVHGNNNNNIHNSTSASSSSSSSSSSSDKNRKSEISAAATSSLRSTPSIEIIRPNTNNSAKTAAAAVDYLESPNTGHNPNNSNHSDKGSSDSGDGNLSARSTTGRKQNSLRIVSSKNGANLRLTPTRENSIARRGVAALFPSIDMDASSYPD